MEDKKFNVNIPEGYDGRPIEIIFREGTAADQLPNKEPQKIEISGVIGSPLRFLEKRVDLLDQKKCNIQVDRESMKIKLTINESDYYKGTITGTVTLSQVFSAFGINTGKKWEPNKLGNFIKMHRSYFKGKQEWMLLVDKLKSFNAKVNQSIEKKKIESGSYSDCISAEVNSNLPAFFRVSLPVFVGTEDTSIEVEFDHEIDGKDVQLTLVSPGAMEVLESYRNSCIDQVLEGIKSVAPDIVIIEL